MLKIEHSSPYLKVSLSGTRKSFQCHNMEEVLQCVRHYFGGGKPAHVEPVDGCPICATIESELDAEPTKRTRRLSGRIKGKE